MCITEEKLINIHNLLKRNFDKIELDKKFDIYFDEIEKKINQESYSKQ